MANKPDMLLWLSDTRGRYIPRDFAKSFADRAKSVSGVSDEDWVILEAGPDHELYWDTWDEITNYGDVTVTDENGIEYFVYQDGDCWLIPKGMEWQDEKKSFAWPTEDEDDDEMDTEN